jgi:radical SAM superfamily enzyme YgiQ (UPF0313 family)
MRLKDPQLIADEIQEIVKETGLTSIEFVDSVFNIPLEHSKAVLRAINAKNLNLKLNTIGINPCGIDEEFVDLLKESNLLEFHITVESGSDKTLRSLGKNFKKSDIIKASQLLKNKGLFIIWDLLTGAPGETEETLKETFETITKSASKWDLIVVGNGIRLYKGSPLSEIIRQEKPDCTEDNFLHPVIFTPQSIDIEEVRAFEKIVSLQHPNMFFYDEVQRLPFFVIKIQNFLLKFMARRKPWWKMLIFFNLLLRITGINLLRRINFEYKKRHSLRKTFGKTVGGEGGILSN